MATISECRYRWLRLPATELIKNPCNLKGLQGFRFGSGIHRNNINNLACRFKPPATTHAIVSGREISQTVGSFPGIDISSRSIGEMLFWHRLVVRDV
jgi:hypothetical protein